MRNKHDLEKMNKGWDKDSGRFKGRGVGNWRGGAFKELGMTIDAHLLDDYCLQQISTARVDERILYHSDQPGGLLMTK